MPIIDDANVVKKTGIKDAFSKNTTDTIAKTIRPIIAAISNEIYTLTMLFNLTFINVLYINPVTTPYVANSKAIISDIGKGGIPTATIRNNGEINPIIKA